MDVDIVRPVLLQNNNNNLNYCKIMYYCGGKMCIDKDKNHQLICKKPLHEYFQSLVQQHKSGECKVCRSYVNLSRHIHILYIDGKIVEVETCPTNNEICGVCGYYISYRGPLKDIKISFNIFYHDTVNRIMPIEYYRCITCQEKDYSMCQTTFNNNKYCILHSNIITLLLSLYQQKFIILPKEIINLIIQNCKLIKDCDC